MKFAAARPYTDPEVAARKLIEIANSVEAVQDGRIHIELINGPFLFNLKATPAEYSETGRHPLRVLVGLGHSRKQNRPL
jgi:hypothetical protein